VAGATTSAVSGTTAVARYRRTLEACDAFLATTEPIAAVGRALGAPTHLQRCGVSAAELALGATARAAATLTPGRVRLGYFSGTATHDDDLASMAPVLADVLARHPAVELLVVGPVTLPTVLAPFATRITRHALVPWPELPTLVASCVASLGAARMAGALRRGQGRREISRGRERRRAGDREPDRRVSGRGPRRP
jgi:hypothetical protein